MEPDTTESPDTGAERPDTTETPASSKGSVLALVLSAGILVGGIVVYLLV